MVKSFFSSVALASLLAIPSVSQATEYPLTVTDISGNQVKIEKEPRRIILQDGRDILALALLDKNNPFERVVAWNNLPKKQDIELWEMLKAKWPESEKIMDMGLSDKGNVDLETILSKNPDLMIAQLRAKPALYQGGILDKLAALHIPVVFVDYEINPVKDTAASIDLLGSVLNKEENAKAYTTYYRQQLDAIKHKTANIKPQPVVFIEPIAGNSEACCFTHAHNGWGGLVEAVGAKNIGSELLPGETGFIALEKLISMKPDVYIMTGSKRGNSQVLPFAYKTTAQAVDSQAEKLLNRTGISSIPAIQNNRVYGVYHHFYNHPYNVVGMEYLAKDIYPQQMKDLDPDSSYHYIIKNFTTLPDNDFVFSWAKNAQQAK